MNFDEIEIISETPLMRNINKCNKISKSPFKILDAPGMVDNFYMNTLDWSKRD